MTVIILHIFALLVFIYLSVNIAYIFVAAIAAGFYIAKKEPPSGVFNRIAVLIPSYNEDEVIINTVQSAVAHNYPPECFEVFVAADHLSDQTIAALRQSGAKIFPLHFERGSKARSLNYLLNSIDESNYDIAVILDGDNIMMPGVLHRINSAFLNGASCVQVHRTAKNKHNAMALLDAMSEEVNNNIFRKGQRALHFSAALIGSGMAFHFSKLKEIYNKPGILDNPACDREVDFEIMKAGIIVEYIHDAYVLDEKVSTSKIFRNQRRRWLESQIIHLRLFFIEKVNPKTADYWNKLFVNLIPPRVFFIIIFLFVALIYLAGGIFGIAIPGVSGTWWIILFTAYTFAMLISIPGNFYRFETFVALTRIPVIIFNYVKALTGIKPQRKEFIHTPKSFIDKHKS